MRDDGSQWTITHMLAALGANAELAAVLSRRVCPAGAVDTRGRTPLHLALAQGHTVAATLLVRARRRLDMQWAAMWVEIHATTLAAAVAHRPVAMSTSSDVHTGAGQAHVAVAGGVDELRGLATSAAASLNAMRAVEQEARASLAASPLPPELTKAPPNAEDASALAKEESRQLSAAAESLRRRIQSVLPGGAAAVDASEAARMPRGEHTKAALSGVAAAEKAAALARSVHDDKALNKEAAAIRGVGAADYGVNATTDEDVRRAERRQRLSRMMSGGR